MELKRISASEIPRALELVERYRLLNEPEQAASICRDVLSADPGNQSATRALLLAITDQFSSRHGAKIEDADAVVAGMESEYERAYYGGIVKERWARARLEAGAHKSLAGDWLRGAMELYEQAEKLAPGGNEDAILRWNACARLIERVPGLTTKPREATNEFEDW